MSFCLFLSHLFVCLSIYLSSDDRPINDHCNTYCHYIASSIAASAAADNFHDLNTDGDVDRGNAESESTTKYKDDSNIHCID